MIKLNRIGNKLGLAGAVGVLLAIGMVANQMVTEFAVEEGSERAARRSRWPIMRCAHIDLRKIQLAASDVRLARTPAEVERPLPICSATRRAQAKELEAALATAQRPDTQGTAAEDQGLDGRLYRRRGRSREGADDAAGADREALGHLGRMEQVRRGPVGLPAMPKLDNRLEIDVCCFRPMQG